MFCIDKSEIGNFDGEASVSEVCDHHQSIRCENLD